MEQEAGLRSSLLGSGGRETDLCVSKEKKKSAVGSLLTRCGSATVSASEEDGEENSRSLEQDCSASLPQDTVKRTKGNWDINRE